MSRRRSAQAWTAASGTRKATWWTPGTRLRDRKVRLDSDMELCGRSAFVHRIHIGARALGYRRCVIPNLPHAEDRREHRVDLLPVGHTDGDRPEAADLMFCRDRAAVPGMPHAGAGIVYQAEALALEILEIQRHPAVALNGPIVLHTLLVEVPCPPAQRFLAGNAQRRAGNAARTRRSGAAGQSKNVMSLPGVASRRRRRGGRRWCRPGSRSS